jgi:hypothetical protein
MNKGFSITLSILILAAILHISVAIHYCDGKEVATKVSLSGELASCDLECSGIELSLPGTNFKKHCCDDLLTYCGIESNYELSSSFVPASCQYNFHVLSLPFRFSANSNSDLIPFCSNLSPPGELLSANVELTNICVFRI